MVKLNIMLTEKGVDRTQVFASSEEELRGVRLYEQIAPHIDALDRDLRGDAMKTTTGRLLSEDETAEILGLSPGTLANWRSKNIGPCFIKAGGRVRYDERDVDAWLKSRRHGERDGNQQ